MKPRHLSIVPPPRHLTLVPPPEPEPKPPDPVNEPAHTAGLRIGIGARVIYALFREILR